eukprot:NODE_8947_length_1458_cov_2.400451.p1 GENE.NODE_8947_length_1458_cov_2.400451~~NODE_8947_length_1458_cov_2.400451.p1  ORF type:complete len:320 (-),score=92.73 NODE_8947_length_1458_cov_2.400451:238-1197(-)
MSWRPRHQYGRFGGAEWVRLVNSSYGFGTSVGGFFGASQGALQGFSVALMHIISLKLRAEEGAPPISTLMDGLISKGVADGMAGAAARTRTVRLQLLQEHRVRLDASLAHLHVLADRVAQRQGLVVVETMFHNSPAMGSDIEGIREAVRYVQTALMKGMPAPVPLQELSNEEQFAVLRHARKVMFVQHPVWRLARAHSRSGHAVPLTPTSFHGLLREMRFRTKATRALDPMFQAQVDLCNPDMIEYDLFLEDEDGGLQWEEDPVHGRGLDVLWRVAKMIRGNYKDDFFYWRWAQETSVALRALELMSANRTTATSRSNK